MGASKLRKLHDPNYGQPCIYTLQFKDEQGDICQIPYSVRRRARPSDTQNSAIALGLQIIGYCVDPEDDKRKFGAWAALEKSESAAGRKGNWERLVPEYKRSHSESAVLSQLEELLEILSSDWICVILDGDGVPLRDGDGNVIELSNYRRGGDKELESSDFLMRAIA